MAVPKVFRWDDVGAPVLSNVTDKAQWLALFQAIFVDGYNGNPGLGWTIEFEDLSTGGTKLVMKQGGSSVDRLWIRWNFYSISVSYQGPFPECAEGYTDINSPTRLFMTGASSQIIPFGFTTVVDGTRISTWVIIGTDTSFYIFGGTNESTVAPTIPPLFSDEVASDRYCSAFFFGNYVPASGSASDNIRSHYMTMKPSSTYGGWNSRFTMDYTLFGGLSQGVNVAYTNRDYDDNYYGSNNVSTVIKPLIITNRGYGYQASAPHYPDPYNSGLYLTNFPIAVNNAYVGKMVGLYFSPQYQVFYNERAKLGGIKIVEGSNEYQGTTFMCFYGRYGNIFIDISNDWVV